MGFKLISLAATILVLSTSVNAALIDNGTYTTDTVSGLDWLDLDYSVAQYYDYAAVNVGLYTDAGSGWGYASNDQVVDIFRQIFPIWAPNHSFGISLNTTLYSHEVDRFISLFGRSDRVTPLADSELSVGMYKDEHGMLRTLGVRNFFNPGYGEYVYGDSYTSVANPLFAYGSTGTFLVRTSVVPVPAAVWLFGSGLIGLVGFVRRKKS